MGLVLIPIGMYKATVDNDIHFAKMSEVNMIYYEKDYYAVPAKRRMTGILS